MKRLIIAVVVLGLVVVGFWAVGKFVRVSDLFAGETAKVEIGEIRKLVSASGRIEANRLIQIKSKASGEVVELPKRDGAFVRKGELLIQLKPDDERRNVERMQMAVDRARTTWEKAQITHRQREADHPISVALATARLESAKARLVLAEFAFKRTSELYNSTPPKASPDEMIRRKSDRDDAQAQRDAAAADLQQATSNQILVDLAAKDVELAKAALDTALKDLEDAQERLAETRIVAPVDGVVFETNTQVGEVIQGGKATITGGTVLMYLADVSRMYVVAQVDEADWASVAAMAPASARPQVGPGATTVGADTPAAPVTVRADAFPKTEFVGIIEQLKPKPNPTAGVVSYDVRILLTSPNRRGLQHGMTAEAEFNTARRQGVKKVPLEALYREGDQVGVYLKTPASPATKGQPGQEFVPVETGIDDGSFIEVRSDRLAAGDDVYTKRPTLTPAQKRREQEADDED